MLHVKYGLDSVVYLKYFYINYDKDGRYAYVKARDVPNIHNKKKVKLDDKIIGVFERLAKHLRAVPRMYDETALSCQRRAFVQLINAIDVVRHQGVPMFSLRDDKIIDSNKPLFDALIGPIGRGGLFNLIPTKLDPTWSFYPPLVGALRPYILVYSILAEYCFHEYPSVPKRAWLKWASERDVPKDIAVKSCVCGKCSSDLDYHSVDTWDSLCQYCAQYNPNDINAKYRTPMWYVANSFASGTSVDQVFTTLNAMERKGGIKPNVDKKYMACAIMSYVKNVGKIDVPEFTSDCVWKIPCHNQQSGGFSLYSQGTFETDDEVFQFVWDANQESAQLPSKLSCKELIDKILLHVKNGGTYNPDMWPLLAAKLAVKAEMKAPGSNPLKCRIFFMVCYLKYLLDYIVLGDSMKKTYGKNGVSIGLKWRDGDAERLARKHHAYTGDFFHIEADAEKLDQSLLASILVLVFSMPFMIFNRVKMTAEWREFLRQLCAFVADGCAVKLIKWIGLQALWVIGIMFSGMLGTSWGDSTYMSLLLICFDFFIYDSILRAKKYALALEFKKSDKPKDIYGDDLLLSYHRKFYKYIIGPMYAPFSTDLSVLSNYLLEAGGVALKPSECFVYSGEDAFFSQVDHTTGLLLKAGPKFLQRRFIKVVTGGVVTAMPWRVITDYYAKSAFSFADIDQDFYWIIKWRALQCDTCGTNKKAYDFFEFLQNKMIALLAFDETNSNTLQWLNKYLSEADMRDSDGMRRFRKLGLRSDYYGKHLSIGMIYSFFLYKENVQWNRAYINDVPYYNRDGSSVRIDRLYVDVDTEVL